MSDTNGAAGGGEGQNQGPRLSILTQYVKDLSFENPKAPRGMQPGQARPEIQVRVDVQAQPVAEDHFEVVIQLNVDATTGGEATFVVELAYGGIFMLQHIPLESLQPLLLIECPRLLFPFARRIVSDVTRDGGFPPLMIDPIDFVSLFRQRVQAAQAASPPLGGDQTLA
jgi:preprotein translocase subunit SecB